MTARQPTLFPDAPTLRQEHAATFDGASYDPARDRKRLAGQLARVRKLMADGGWRTLGEIAAAVGGSEAGCSARLRDLRKPRFGGLTVERRRAEYGNGLHQYRLVTR